MKRFEVAIEGSKKEFNNFPEAKAHYDEMRTKGFWEAVMRMHEDGKVYLYNPKAGAFFAAY